MASTSAPSPLHFCKMSIPFHPPPIIARISPPKLNLRHANLSHNASQSMRFHNCDRRMRTAASGGADESEPREEHGALEAVMKLYEAIRNKNVNQLSDIIAEECSCVSNFVSSFQPVLGKKQVLGFFWCLMKCLGNNNIEFVVQQTLDYGMVVSVSWKLEWSKAPLHLGKGFSFYTCHVYQGKVMIRNVEMFLEPVFHMVPLRLKLMSVVMEAVFKNRARKVIALFSLLLVAALVCLFKYSAAT